MANPIELAEIERRRIRAEQAAAIAADEEGATHGVAASNDRRFGVGQSPVADNCYAFSQGASSARTTVGTSRIPHTVAVDCTDLRLVYGNWFNNGTAVSPNYVDADGTAVVQIKASIEISGTIYRVTFGGSITGTMDPAGMLISDPLPVDLTAGTVIYSRTFLASGTVGWYYNKYSYAAGGSGGFTTTTDLTAPGSGAVTDSSFVAQFGPMTILGTSLTGTTPPSVLIIGDSIAHGYGDAPSTIPFQGRNITTPALAGGGYIARGLYGRVGYIQTGFPGDTAALFNANAGHFRRMTLASLASTAIVEHGRNDISSGAPLATAQSRLVALWGLCANRGLRVIQTTITPQTTSTDGWVTAGGQTAVSSESVRVAFNDWLRAGAPLVSGVAVAAGTAGAALTGHAGHPLYAVFDAADLVETARNSGLWKPMTGVRTVTDGVATNGSGTVTSATANFQTSDVGRNVTIAGAGAGGALITVMIVARNASTSIQVDTNASTTVSGAVMTIGDATTVDGLHPSPYGATVMAAAIDTSKIA